jgi:hypothetical protein
VAGPPPAGPPTTAPSSNLYDGPLGGVPSSGYAYWGYDFTADETGTPSPVRPDEFINRSDVPVTIVLSFDFPTDHPCHKDCTAGVEFRFGPAWSKVAPPAIRGRNTVSFWKTFVPGQGYGWTIGLWQSTNPRLTVTVPAGSTATIEDVGLSRFPAVATEVAATSRICDCGDATTAPCSAGSRFSNGLLGMFSRSAGYYVRAGAFNECLPRR